jgi:nitrate reductase gamma subunit
MSFLIAVVIPYAAAIIFLTGLVYRFIQWTSAPVPFRIPTTCGQQASLPWIRSSRLDNPHTTAGVIGRMALEILCFRSLFRNTGTDLKRGPVLVCDSAKWLWLAALAFHWSLFIIVVRHLRLLVEPELLFIATIQSIDGFFQVGLPALFISDALILSALTYLLLRRVADPKLRYISLAADFFPLLLIGFIAGTGVWMRHVDKVNLRLIKEFAVGLARLRPSVPEGVGFIFYTHLFLVSLLIAYIPFSKLMHMGGLFLSPTRNLANTSRMRRHINPWNSDVKVHAYEDYEDEFRTVMVAAGLPVEKNNPDADGGEQDS